MMLIEWTLSAFLLGGVVFDVLSHRLPNRYLQVGLVVAVSMQSWLLGWQGVLDGGAGLLTGFAVFLPFYVMRGMAAGDVKFMAVTGCFLGASGAMWAAAYSLMAGSLLGMLYLFYRGSLWKFCARYWAIFSLRSHIPAEDDDASKHRFPYAIAIATGTLLSLCWTPI